MKINEGNIEEVEEIDKKLNQLKSIKENILSNNLKNREKEEIEFINKKHLGEIDDFNQMYNTNYEELVINHNLLKEKLLEKHEEERNNLIFEFQKNLSKININKSPKFKELQKLKIFYLNKKDFEKANNYENQIKNYENSEIEKMNLQNKNNLELKLNNLQKIHDIQIQEFEHKLRKKLDKLELNRKSDLLKIIHRQKKELKNLTSLYKVEENSLKKNNQNNSQKIDVFESMSKNSSLTNI